MGCGDPSDPESLRLSLGEGIDPARERNRRESLQPGPAANRPWIVPDMKCEMDELDQRNEEGEVVGKVGERRNPGQRCRASEAGAREPGGECEHAARAQEDKPRIHPR